MGTSKQKIQTIWTQKQSNKQCFSNLTSITKEWMKRIDIQLNSSFYSTSKL